MKVYLDIGGTNIRIEKVHGNESELTVMKTNDTDIVSLFDEITRMGDVDFVGISFAGQVNRGVIISAPNIDIRMFDVEGFFRKRGIKARIDNDLKCAALAEYDANRETKMLSVIYIGTGFGSAHVQSGKLLRGSGNLAGEIGHMPFRKAPFTCGCGGDDCVELYTSGLALKKWMGYLGIEGVEPTLDALRDLNSEDSRLILRNFYDGLSFAMRSLVALLNPDAIVMGGSVVKNNPGLVEFVKDEIARRAFKPASEVIVYMSTLKGGNLIGARLLEFVDD